MYVIIPVAHEPNNLSLPYVIASIRKHTDYTPVTVGHDHGLCDHIPTIQLPGRANAFKNTANAMRTAIHEIAEPLIWCDDDTYWLRPAQPTRWAIGTLENDNGPSVYQQRKHTTWQTLRSLGLPTYDYESHTPLPVNDLDAMNLALNLTGTMRSLYGNLTGQPDVIAPDVKMRRKDASLPDAAWASTHGDPNRYPHLIEALTS